MKLPKLTTLFYLPVGLLAIAATISLARSWKDMQGDGQSHQVMPIAVSSIGTSFATKAPVQSNTDPTVGEKSAPPSSPLESLHVQGSEQRSLPMTSQPYASRSVSYSPPIQPSTIPSGISPPIQGVAISALTDSSSAPQQSSRPVQTSYATPSTSGSSCGSFISAAGALSPPIFSGVPQSAVVAPSGSSAVAPVTASDAPTVSIPAAFANPASVGATTADQNQQLAQIANNFTSAVQNSGVSPSSPAYQGVWNSAAQQANAIFKQQFGNAAFEAAQQSANSQ